MRLGGTGGAPKPGEENQGFSVDMLGLRYLLDIQEEVLNGQLYKQICTQRKY